MLASKFDELKSVTPMLFAALFSITMIILSVLPSFAWWFVSQGEWAKAIYRTLDHSECIDPYLDSYFNAQTIIAARSFYVLPFSFINNVLQMSVGFGAHWKFMPPLYEHVLFLANSLLLAFMITAGTIGMLELISKRFRVVRQVCNLISARWKTLVVGCGIGIVMNFLAYEFQSDRYGLQPSECWLDERLTISEVCGMFDSRNLVGVSATFILTPAQHASITSRVFSKVPPEETFRPEYMASAVGMRDCGRRLQEVAFFFDRQYSLVEVWYSETHYKGGRTGGAKAFTNECLTQ